MGDDKRSRRVVLVMHCLLNQNSRAQECAVYAGANTDVLEILTRHGVGIIQMPCPEMAFMGLARSRREDQTIWDVIDTPEGHACCRELSARLVDDVQDYQKNGYEVVAILGGNERSPGCAVHHLDPEGGRQKLADESGVFMRELVAELQSRDIDIPIRGMRDDTLDTLVLDLPWLEETLGAVAG